MRPLRRRVLRTLLGLLLAVCAGPFLVWAGGEVALDADWRNADRGSVGLAPPAAAVPTAMVQVYAARAFGWRGLFGVHTWIALKPAQARHYTVHQVLGWKLWRGRDSVESAPDLPDRRWYGARPWLLRDLRGPAAAALIPPLEAAIARYPYARRYVLWPGPNSNTFVAWVAREVPALGLALPATAIGKDWLGDGARVARAPSGSGWQLSLGGFLGVTLAWREGLEFNLLGAVFGIDLRRPALKLPGLGRLGFAADT